MSNLVVCDNNKLKKKRMTKPQLRSGELELPHLLVVVLEDTTIKIV
jgi:hypothetical protein